MQQAGYILDIPNVQEYISLYAERVEDTCHDDLVDQIVANYSPAEEEETEAEEDPIEPKPLVTHEEALQALHLLCRYNEENTYGDRELLRMLRKQDREISTRLQGSYKQVRLDQWFIRESN
jgi:hypothetical protein